MARSVSENGGGSVGAGEEIRVLLVEDNPGDARLVEFMLEEVGNPHFDLQHVERLDEALELAGEIAFDVALLDLSLPDAHGLETVERIRGVALDLPVVVLSGTDDEAVALKALGSGAEDYLVKGQGDGHLVARAIRYAIERKRAEQRLAYLSQYDHLTGLANRALLQDRLGGAIARADRSSTVVALMLLGLDRFKSVNDLFGHRVGDMLLKEVADRLKGSVRSTDTVARMGGDEFALIVEEVSDAQEVAPLAQKMMNTLAEPYQLGGREVFVSASMGIAVRPPSESESVLKDAGAAMQRAKRQGNSSYQFYSPEMNVQAFERLAFESSLRRALEREEFLLHYQPQIDLRSGRIVGAEALLRWQHPDLGLVSPARFIPVLEETGMIVPVGEWVLRKACAQALAWDGAGLPRHRVAVNLSARQFRQEDLTSTIAAILEETGLESWRLELELTESLLLEDADSSSKVIEGLKSGMGLRISVDDFGTGYSSLNRLKRLPIDVLKVDQSFVRDIPDDTDDATIVSAIINLAHNLRLNVIAEGVETAQQLNFLREQGCDEAQGYYVGNPLPATEYAKLLKKSALP